MIPAPVVLQIGRNLPSVINDIIGGLIRFFPRLIWSLVVLAAGVGVAIFVSSKAEDAVEDSEFLADRLADPVEFAVKVLLVFFAVTIALSELGIDTSVLLVFLDGVAFGLGVGVALVVGIALGWGSKDYVADHVEEWIHDVVEDADTGGASSTGSADGDDGE